MQLFMVEEFEKKNKGILDRECEEFRQQLERELSTSLSFQIDRGEQYPN